MKVKETEAIIGFINFQFEQGCDRINESSSYSAGFKEGYASAFRDFKIISNEIPDYSPSLIDVEFLMALHPELSKKDAESLRMFSSNYEIKYIEQYAGSIMYPMWEKECKQKP